MSRITFEIHKELIFSGGDPPEYPEGVSQDYGFEFLLMPYRGYSIKMVPQTPESQVFLECILIPGTRVISWETYRTGLWDWVFIFGDYRDHLSKATQADALSHLFQLRQRWRDVPVPM